MILYSNLCEVEVNGMKMQSKAVLKLTSAKYDQNNISLENSELLDLLFKEAEENGFEVKIGEAK